MKTTYVTKKTGTTEKEKQLIEKKLCRLDKFFTGEADAVVTMTGVREQVRVEITVKDRGMLFRGERSATDKLTAVDEIVDLLIRQVRKNKTRLTKRTAEPQPDFEPWDEGEDEFPLVRTKELSLRPMSLEEAIMQMNLLGHNFFMFRDSETERTCVVYLRNDGGYGLLRDV